MKPTDAMVLIAECNRLYLVCLKDNSDENWLAYVAQIERTNKELNLDPRPIRRPTTTAKRRRVAA